MKTGRTLKYLALAGMLAFLAGCGGSAGYSNVGIDGSGSAVASASKGPIESFGSVVVNGVRYNTTSATVFVSGELGTETELNVGSYITVIGSINEDGVTGTATIIRFQPNVMGPIDSISDRQDTFTVLGQTIRVTNETSFDRNITPKNLSGLSVDDRVEVSGFVNSMGEVVATRIDRVVETDLEVWGSVANLNSESQRFELNGLTVDYGSSTVLGASEGLINGVEVIVEATSIVDGALIAEVVEVNEGYLDYYDDVEEFELEGAISVYSSSNSFSVNGVPVITNDSTRFINGSSSDLSLNQNVFVEGEFNDDAVLVAEEIEILREGDLTVVGAVSDVAVSSSDDTIGQLTVQGVTFRTSLDTRFEDDGGMELEQFDLSDIRVGDFVIVVGWQDGDIYYASAVVREEVDGAEEFEVQGIPDSIGETSFELYGLTISFNEETEFGYDGDSISLAEFVELGAGRLVEVIGTINDLNIVAEDIEIIEEFLDDDDE